MCLAVPGKIISMEASGTSPRMAKADIGGIIRDVCIDWLPDLQLEEYVIIHAGFALNRIEEKEAAEQLNAIRHAEEIITRRMKE